MFKQLFPTFPLSDVLTILQEKELICKEGEQWICV